MAMETVDYSPLFDAARSGNLAELATKAARIALIHDKTILAVLHETRIPFVEPNANPGTPSHPATVLHVATFFGYFDVAKWLLERGFSPNRLLAPGRRLSGAPLHWACREGNLQIARLLIQHGASVDLGEISFGVGHRPIFIAIEAGHNDVVALLLQYGANPNISVGVENPLSFAAQCGNIDAICIIIFSQSLKFSPWNAEAFHATDKHILCVLRLLLDPTAHLFALCCTCGTLSPRVKAVLENGADIFCLEELVWRRTHHVKTHL